MYKCTSNAFKCGPELNVYGRRKIRHCTHTLNFLLECFNLVNKGVLLEHIYQRLNTRKIKNNFHLK